MSANPAPGTMPVAGGRRGIHPDHTAPPPRAVIRGAVDRLRGLLRKMVRSAARKRSDRRAIAQLRGFSDRDLKDLGLGRSQIVHAVRHGREHRPRESDSK